MPDGWVFAVDKRRGTLLWKHKVEGVIPLLTQSPTIVNKTPELEQTSGLCSASLLVDRSAGLGCATTA